ncbi:MAG: hypothetical protein IPL39_04905 [Opitutaceae bacterium]|nr:hypothetical protein [Opitutaceae bacterium]
MGTDLGYAAMQPFTSGQGTTTHGVTFNGLSADPTKLNRVFVRCDAAPTQLLQLKYRAITGANPSFPRKANLWGWSNFFPNGSVDHAKRIDLWMGVHAGPDQVMPLRGVHPDVVVMESCSAVEQSDTNAWMVPEDYWLRDVDGNRVKAWGGMYRLNLTKPEVARFQARYAYQRLVDGDLCMDGLFFDNFLTSHPTVFVYDANTSFVVDADGDGQKDAPDHLSDAWRAGVYREMIEFRKLMPHALVAGHLEDHEIETEGDFFSGDSMGLVMPEFKDGPAFKDGHDMFRKFWDPYHSWWTWGLRPILTTIEGAPPNELSYGYGEKVTTDMPASTLEFARTCYPYMRWGLGVALMNDGYSMYEHGDNYHGPDWWYDELDFNLGYPLGPCQRLDLGTVPATDYFRNGGFDAALAPAWTTWVNTNRGAVASFTRDTTQAGTGAACCRVDIVEPGLGANGQIIEWDVRLDQTNVEVIAGMAYDISFRARSTSGPHHVSVGAGTNWESGTGFEVGDTWRTYSSVVVGKVAAMNAIVSINFGAQTGTVWIDEVKLVQHQPHIYRRDFDNGTVILNGSKERQVIPVTGAYKRLGGTQAPLYQYVIDDVAPAFTAGGWGAAVYDSRLKQSTGPYFHDWGAGCHQSSIVNDTATWDLGIRADDTYMLDAWWPAAPAASGWSSAVRYDVIVGGVMVATKTFDQTKQGDQWHRIASVALTKAAGAQVRITNLQAKPAIADAILVQSAARYNDGSDAPSVALDPCDAIILEKKR